MAKYEKVQGIEKYFEISGYPGLSYISKIVLNFFVLSYFVQFQPVPTLPIFESFKSNQKVI